MSGFVATKGADQQDDFIFIRLIYYFRDKIYQHNLVIPSEASEERDGKLLLMLTLYIAWLPAGNAY